MQYLTGFDKRHFAFLCRHLRITSTYFFHTPSRLFIYSRHFGTLTSNKEPECAQDQDDRETTNLGVEYVLILVTF